MKLVIKDSADGQFFVSLLAKNGRVLMTSETYKAKAKAKRLATNLDRDLGTAVTLYDLTKRKATKKK